MNQSETALLKEAIKKIESLLDTSKDSSCGCSVKAKNDVRLYVESWILSPLQIAVDSLVNKNKYAKREAHQLASYL